MKTLVSILLVSSTVTFTGCGGWDSNPTVTDGLGVAVSYRSDPLTDVHVRLHGSATGPILAEAVSSTDGIARFAETPLPQPDEYFVSLSSLGDGGWILDAKYLKPTDSGLKLKSLATDDPQQIKLPRGAVRPLTPTHHH
ncbi:hypothetical protein Pla52o_45410 [Novipirellula galeiformis]|uniref:Uncharacterized protein n=1 Tax=Novipirellula galeiformis TaxID=2528004 RepID=A0A5C6C908_9BACT|nr:hypothetical protein [Novipirellula galeiformis]TWU20662.1 hypothetical protein Pla52o_45410 [Novipirellula galeiformis]